MPCMDCVLCQIMHVVAGTGALSVPILLKCLVHSYWKQLHTLTECLLSWTDCVSSQWDNYDLKIYLLDWCSRGWMPIRTQNAASHKKTFTSVVSYDNRCVNSVFTNLIFHWLTMLTEQCLDERMTLPWGGLKYFCHGAHSWTFAADVLRWGGLLLSQWVIVIVLCLYAPISSKMRCSFPASLRLYFFLSQSAASTFSVSFLTLSLIVEQDVSKHDIWE